MDAQNWDQEWQGLEPEQPRSGRCGCWLGALILLLALSGACIGTGYFAWRQLDLPIDPGSVLVPPTVAPFNTAPAVDGDIIGTPGSEQAGTRPALAPTVTLASGTVQAPAVASEEVEAVRLSGPPAIDGILSDWADLPTYESAYQVFSDASWDGSDDVRAAWRLGWDADNFYIAVQVADDVHVQTEQGNTIFKGDGVSIQLDTQLENDYGPRLSPDDFQINLSPGDFGANPPAAFRFRADNSGNLVDMVGHGIQVAALPSTTGYALEAAIPWSNLGINPQPGLQMGIALNVNDNDTPETAVQEVMKSQVASRRFGDPTSWGTIVLRNAE